MAVREAPVDVTVRVDDLARILRDMKAFQPKLATALRRRIRDAAKVAVTDMQAEVRSGPGKANTGLREGIARGIAVRISTGQRSAGVRIVSTGSKLPTNKKPMVKAYNRTSFRHPTFGNTQNWQTQAGRPYFGSVIAKQRDEIAKAIAAALDEAAATLAHRY